MHLLDFPRLLSQPSQLTWGQLLHNLHPDKLQDLLKAAQAYAPTAVEVAELVVKQAAVEAAVTRLNSVAPQNIFCPFIITPLDA